MQTFLTPLEKVSHPVWIWVNGFTILFQPAFLRDFMERLLYQIYNNNDANSCQVN